MYLIFVTNYTLQRMSSLFTRLFCFVNYATNKYRIDESHGLSHSMNVLHFAHNIYEYEKYKNPILIPQEKVIYVSAVLHDMCDKKYMDEKQGILEISNYLSDKITPKEIDATRNIISTMSYSTVKKYGFPQLGEYQLAYHIVREADLLSAYDFDRSMIYHMQKNNCDIYEAYHNAHHLFIHRVLRHNDDSLFLSKYSQRVSVGLHKRAIERMMTWQKILKI